MAFSSNGLWAAHVSFGEETRPIVLWNLKEWQQCGPRFHIVPPLNPDAMALSDDARWCLYADSMGGVHRLGEAGAEVWEGRAHRDLTIVRLLAISADGRGALSACQDGRLVAWDIAAGSHEIIWDESDNYVEASSLDSTGASAVAARADGTVYLLNLWPARARTLFTLNSKPSALARSADNTVVAVAIVDGSIEVRAVEAPEAPIRIFRTDEKPTSVAVSSDARYLSAGTDKGTVAVWSIERGVRSALYRRAHTYKIEGLTFSHDGARIVSADALHLKEWALQAADEKERGLADSPVAGEVKVTADGLHAVAVLEDGRLALWQLRTGAQEAILPGGNSPTFGDSNIGQARNLAFAAKTARVLAWNEKLLCVWDLDDAVNIGALGVTNTRDAHITPDGTAVVYLDDKKISLWQLDEGSSTVLGRHGGDLPYQLAVSPDGKCALSSGGDRRVVAWRLNDLLTTSFSEIELSTRRYNQIAKDLGLSLKNESELASWWIAGKGKPDKIAFPGETEAIITTDDGCLFTIDLSHPKTSEPSGWSARHKAHLSKLVVSPDGTVAVTSSYDNTNMVWNVAERRLITVLTAHPGHIEQLSASRERALLTTFDGILKVVSLDDGALLAAFQGDKLIVACAADADLEWIVGRDEGGQVHFFHLEKKI